MWCSSSVTRAFTGRSNEQIDGIVGPLEKEIRKVPKRIAEEIKLWDVEHTVYIYDLVRLLKNFGPQTCWGGGERKVLNAKALRQ